MPVIDARGYTSAVIINLNPPELPMPLSSEVEAFLEIDPLMPRIDPSMGHAKLNAIGQAKYEAVGIATTRLLRVLENTGALASAEGTLAHRALQQVRFWASKSISMKAENQEGGGK